MPPKPSFSSRGFRVNVLHSRAVLYFVFAVAIVNFYVHLATRDSFSIAVFLLSGLLTSFFSKNMIVVLVSAVVVTNVLKHGKNVVTHEGFEAGAEGAAEKSKDAATSPPAEGAAAAAAAPAAPALPDAEDTEEIKKKYKELLDLQKQIVDGVKNVYEPLQKAEIIVAGMKESMQNQKRAA
jgi:hypothetical protein